MFKKYLIIASKKNIAAMNIVNNLAQFRKNPLLTSMSDAPNFDIDLIEESVLENKNLDLDKIDKYDFVIFPCTHRSEKGEKSLSIHSPGNWRDAKLGGNSYTVSRASALFNKTLFENLEKTAKEYKVDEKYFVTLEVTHHGPTITKPCVFIEIGSTEEEWKDRRAGFVVAKTIVDTINNFKENPYREIAIGIGGPHYCPNFNKIQLKSNVAFAHIIPNYVAPINEEMIREAIEKTSEQVDFAVLDWKGLGPADKRQEVIDTLEKLYINWKKTGEISK